MLCVVVPRSSAIASEKNLGSSGGEFAALFEVKVSVHRRGDVGGGIDLYGPWPGVVQWLRLVSLHVPRLSGESYSAHNEEWRRIDDPLAASLRHSYGIGVVAASARRYGAYRFCSAFCRGACQTCVSGTRWAPGAVTYSRTFP